MCRQCQRVRYVDRAQPAVKQVKNTRKGRNGRASRRASVEELPRVHLHDGRPQAQIGEAVFVLLRSALERADDHSGANIIRHRTLEESARNLVCPLPGEHRHTDRQNLRVLSHGEGALSVLRQDGRTSRVRAVLQASANGVPEARDLAPGHPTIADRRMHKNHVVFGRLRFALGSGVGIDRRLGVHNSGACAPPPFRA